MHDICWPGRRGSYRVIVLLAIVLLLSESLGQGGKGGSGFVAAQGIELASATPAPGTSALGPAGVQQLCPGISGGVCGRVCQVHICRALQRFYTVTLNTSDPWDNEDGWELTASMSCEQLVGPGANQAAVYCTWFGITCCQPDAVAAGNCSAVNTIHGIRLPINNLNASVGDLEVVKPMQQLHDCGLRVLDLEANNLVGAFHPAWGGLKDLIVFNFGNCWIAGRLPDTLRSMRNLTYINLSNNWLNGTLPAWLDEFKQLRVLQLGSQLGGNEGTDELGLVGTIPTQLGNLRQLRELNLEANGLTGSLPANLCSGDNSELLLLTVKGNKLSGNVTCVESCGNLVQLDISDNQLTGLLPASADWDELASYRACHNQFTGQVPVTLATYARILEHLDISHNQLTGKFPNQITLLSGLKTLNIAGNMFSGTLTEDVFFLPALLNLDVSNNRFVGTIPEAIGLAYSLQIVDYSNNPGVTGQIPPQIGLLESLQVVRLQNTSLSCSGIIRPYNVTTNASCSDPERCKTPQFFGSIEAQRHVCSPDEQLPCFLHFSAYLTPREDESNMRCRYILRLPQEAAIEACSGSEPTDLADYADLLPATSPEAYDQTWYVDPVYYQYQACECLVGYTEVWDEHHTVLRCVPEDVSAWLSYKRTAVIVGTIAGFLVICLIAVVWRQYLTTRPRWLRERIMQSKRTKGAPRCTKPGEKVTVSIVVTDVKDFSELTRKCPELVNKAMGGHNNILRKACHAHAGYVMDQEGDSWTVAFHDAEDAVAFGLQVQQALAHKVWGMRLGASEAALAELRNMTSVRDEGFSTKLGTVVQGSATTSMPNLLPGSRESSLTPASPVYDRTSAAAAAVAASVQHSGLAVAGDNKEPQAVTSTGPSFTGPSFTANSWPGGHISSNCSSHGDLNQLVQPTNSADAATNRSLLAGWLGRLARRDGSQSSSHLPEHVSVSFSDTRGLQDTSVLQRLEDGKDSSKGKHGQQPLNGGNAVVGSGGSWGSGKGPEAAALARDLNAHNTSKSSFGSGMLYWGAGPGDAAHRDSASTGYRDDRASSKLWTSMVKFSHFGFGRGTSQSKSVNATVDQPPMQILRLAVRIGIATGQLQYGTDVNNCAIKDRARELVSDVANGGQVLVDESTFLLIKDSLSVLGTVTENGLDDKLVQQLMQAQVLDKYRRPLGCTTCPSLRQRSMSFSSDVLCKDAQDYDNDAIAVHMGCFEVPAAAHASDDSGKHESGELLRAVPSPKSESHIELVAPKAVSDAHLARPADVKAQQPKQQLHLFSVAAPGMRQRAGSTQDLSRTMAWADPVNMKVGWVQVQKGYFDAPGARQMDLSASSPLYNMSHAPLPDVTIIFASVAGASNFTFRRSRNETYYVNKVIRTCMLQQLAVMPGNDGYLCRCQVADLKYMIAFENPHRAVQWCLAVQEALMYFTWPSHILSHPGFEEVVDPETGLPLFRGPRLRMGLAEGQPNSVLPDHNGRANYYGGSVNRAARYMDAAAHGGQVVTDVPLLRKLIAAWAAEDKADSAANSTDDDQLDVPSSASAAAAAAQANESQDKPHLEQLHLQPQIGMLQESHMQPRPQQRWQRSLPPLAPVPTPSSVASSTVDVLPVLPPGDRSRRWRQQHQATAEQDLNGLLEPAQRSRSESYARQVKFSFSPHSTRANAHYLQLPQLPSRQLPPLRASSSSFTYGSLRPAADMRSPFMQLHASPPSVTGCTGLSGLPEAGLVITSQDEVLPAACEPVYAYHVGTFSFKGSGEYEMAQLLHASLRRRQFPEEPPKGKGQRLVNSTEPVEDLQDVELQIPQCLLAARRAYRHGLPS